jgi:hypothetical protein
VYTRCLTDSEGRDRAKTDGMVNDPDLEHLLRRLPHLEGAVPCIRAAAAKAVAMLYGGRRAETMGVLLALAPVLDSLRADPRVHATRPSCSGRPSATPSWKGLTHSRSRRRP